jgi:hypothetical protein
MSGFLSKTRNDEEPPDGNDEDQKQEIYAMLHEQIAKDFLDKDDFIAMMQKLVELIDPENRFGLDWTFSDNANRKTADYKDL